ncbi:MAG: hypothetical protein IPL31_04230 [Saprospiraceae bacterium]|nr:hypothetical protein [Saprospiraceae bacterium]
MKTNIQSLITRKKFLIWSAAILAATGLIKIWNPIKKKNQESFKFLTQDGKLVEVSSKHLKTKGIKMYTSELQNWIKQ